LFLFFVLSSLFLVFLPSFSFLLSFFFVSFPFLFSCFFYLIFLSSSLFPCFFLPLTFFPCFSPVFTYPLMPCLLIYVPAVAVLCNETRPSVSLSFCVISSGRFFTCHSKVANKSVICLVRSLVFD
jgi:hypothetical protein